MHPNTHVSTKTSLRASASLLRGGLCGKHVARGEPRWQRAREVLHLTFMPHPSTRSDIVSMWALCCIQMTAGLLRADNSAQGQCCLFCKLGMPHMQDTWHPTSSRIPLHPL